MQIIGITGRSGCGKSTLTDSIRAVGFRCVDADQVAREVLLPGSPCLVQLQQEFGGDNALLTALRKEAYGETSDEK